MGWIVLRRKFLPFHVCITCLILNLMLRWEVHIVRVIHAVFTKSKVFFSLMFCFVFHVKIAGFPHLKTSKLLEISVFVGNACYIYSCTIPFMVRQIHCWNQWQCNSVLKSLTFPSKEAALPCSVANKKKKRMQQFFIYFLSQNMNKNFCGMSWVLGPSACTKVFA